MQITNVISPDMSDAWALGKDVITIVVVPFCLYIVKELKEISKAMSELSTVLIGIGGKNGMRSRVARNESRIRGMELTMERSGFHIRSDNNKGDDDDI